MKALVLPLVLLAVSARAQTPPPQDASVARAAALNLNLPDAPDFDGSAAKAAPAGGEGESSSAVPDLRVSASDVRGLGLKPANPHEKRDKIEDAAFWSTWGGYHAAWAADFATTGMILARGGHEKDPLYTAFGNKNMIGVIGSATVVHVGLSAAGVLLHEEAKKHSGAMHYALEAAAIGINCAGVGIHASAAAGNVGVMQNWGRR